METDGNYNENIKTLLSLKNETVTIVIMVAGHEFKTVL